MIINRATTEKRDAEESFWLWFVAHETELWTLDPDKLEERDCIFERVEAELHKVDARLTFEFGPRTSRRDFVLSADGLREAFAAVTRLTAAAPELLRWNVIAFRPRRGEHGTIEMDGTEIHGEDIRFTLLEKGSDVGLRLFIPGYTDANLAMKAIGYLFLDEALGEYDVEMGLTLIRFHAPEDLCDGNRHPLAELPELFDTLVARLRGNSGKVN